MTFLDFKISVGDYFIRRKQHKLYKKMKSVGKNVYICNGLKIDLPEKVTIGDNVWIGINCMMAASGGLTIKNGTIMSHNIEIWTMNHNFNSEDLMSIPYDKRFVEKPVIIDENVWVGSRVIILSGVHIEEGSVIGAGAVVTKDVPACAIVGGNPARILKYRDQEQYHRLKNDDKIYLKLNYNYDVSSKRSI